MQCSHCGHQQQTGHFCGMCGVQFDITSHINTSQSTVTISNGQMHHPPTNTESNVQLEQLKEKTILYLHYFIRYLKNPSLIINQKQEEYKNGLITILLFSIIVGLTFYHLAANLIYLADDSTFLSQFGGFFLIALCLIAIGLLSLSLINHFFGPQFPFKSVISLYGAHLSLLTLLALASLMLIAIKSFAVGHILLVITVLFTIFVLPLYLTVILLTKKSVGIDSFYGSVVYLITFSTLLLIFLSLFGDSPQLQLFIQTAIRS